MAVVSINRLNRQSTDEQSLRITEVYLAVLDDGNTPLEEIMTHSDMPKPGDAHPEYSWLFVLNRPRRQEQESRLLSEFEVVYGQFIINDDTIDKILQGGDPITLTEPEQRPPTYTWRTVEVQKPLRYHRCTTRGGEVVKGDGTVMLTIASGKMVRNTAMIPFDPPPSYRAFHRVYTARRFESTWNDAAASGFLFRVNSTPFAGKDPYTVICSQLDAETVYVNDGSGAPRLLYAVSYQFEWDEEGQWVDVPNVSAMEFDGSEYTWITDSNGDKVAHAVYLDEAGLALPAGDVEADEMMIRVYPYEETDFSALGLG